MGRAPCCDKGSVKKGPWSPEEDKKLKEYIRNNGTGGNWIALPTKAGLKRCGKSCRLRWLNYLRPNIKHGDFSDEEDRVICALFATIGSRWSIIAAQIPGRTDNDIKNYWSTKLKKKQLHLLDLIAAPRGHNQNYSSKPLAPPPPQFTLEPYMSSCSSVDISNNTSAAGLQESIMLGGLQQEESLLLSPAAAGLQESIMLGGLQQEESLLLSPAAAGLQESIMLGGLQQEESLLLSPAAAGLLESIMLGGLQQEESLLLSPAAAGLLESIMLGGLQQEESLLLSPVVAGLLESIMLGGLQQEESLLLSPVAAGLLESIMLGGLQQEESLLLSPVAAGLLESIMFGGLQQEESLLNDTMTSGGPLLLDHHQQYGRYDYEMTWPSGFFLGDGDTVLQQPTEGLGFYTS